MHLCLYSPPPSHLSPPDMKQLGTTILMVVNDEKNQDEDDDGDGGADVDCGEKHSQFYTYKLPIDRLSGCYW